MNKIVKTFLLLVSIMILSSSFVFASDAQDSQLNNKVNIEYFWGDGCSHCANLEPWLDSFEKEYADKVILNRHEIWKNRQEAVNFSQLMQIYGVPKDQQGTPTLIVNNKVVIGSADIKKNLKNEVDKALESLNNSSVNVTNSKAVTDKEAGKILAPMTQNQVIPTTPTSSAQSDANNKALESTDLKAIFLTALADSINPCAIMVLIILLSSLLIYQKENMKKIILTAISFISAVYITYFSIGFGFTSIIATTTVAKTIAFIVGIIAIIIGLLNIKDAFFYRAGNWAIEIPARWRSRLTKVILSATSPAGAFVAGVTVTFFELPCTGGPYLFGISLISMSPMLLDRILLLLFYNLIFVSPLVFIAILVIKGIVSIENAEKLRNDNVKAMHLITGVIMILVGIWAIALK